MLFGLLRGAYYLDSRPTPAAAVAAVYGALTVGGMFILSYAGTVSGWSAVLVMGLSAAVPSVCELAASRSVAVSLGYSTAIRLCSSRCLAYPTVPAAIMAPVM